MILLVVIKRNESADEHHQEMKQTKMAIDFPFVIPYPAWKICRKVLTAFLDILSEYILTIKSKHFQVITICISSCYSPSFHTLSKAALIFIHVDEHYISIKECRVNIILLFV